MNQNTPQNEKLVQTIMENLHLNEKQAKKFAEQTKALQKNIKLRKKQKEEREKTKK